MLVSLLACGRYTIDRLQTVSYSYQNQSGQDLTLDVYNVQGQVFKRLELPNDSTVLLYTSQVEGPAFFYFESSTDRIGDSVVVNFEGNRCLHYTRDHQGKIFQLEAYQNHQAASNGTRRYHLYYQFTIEDYKQAAICK